MTTVADQLRALLNQGRLLIMPCCFDALSARMTERSGFALTFMSGFGVSAARHGLPDTGLISYAEMADQGRAICAAVSIPVIGDGDTGFGNAVNVKRTVNGYTQAGFAAVMIEDQVAPKRCGHTHGKAVVERPEALARIRAAIDARDEGQDIMILARTDARATHGLDEAILRARSFVEAGADIVFVEAPKSEEEMEAICRDVPGWKMVNMLEGGETPILPPDRLEAMGYAIAAYPLTLLSAATRAMKEALADLRTGRNPTNRLLDFDELRETVGFDDYDREARRYTDPES